MDNSAKLLFPDSLYDLNSISCASFMYFEKGQIAFSLHPTVSTYLSGCDPYDFFLYVQKKNPPWSNDYFLLFKLWVDSNNRLQQTNQFLLPLNKLKVYKSILLVYSKTEEILHETEEFISRLGMSYEDLFNVINIDHAAQELMAHIHFEKTIELYGSISQNTGNEFIKRNVDYHFLFNYCDFLFKNTTIKQALVKAYFFRLMTMGDFDNFMLSNENLIPLLSKLPQKSNEIELNQEVKPEDTLDIVSWEVFRQIISPYLDEKEPETRINITTDFLQTRNDEIRRLKTKCWILAENFKSDYDLLSLKNNIAKHIALNVENDVRDLLTLDKNSFGEIRDQIFSDEKTWLAILTFITSIFTGGELITAGAGLATLSNIAAKTYSTKSNINKAIKKSDYTLLYRIKKSSH